MERVANRTSFMDNTKSQQQRRGSLVPMSPTQMLWSSENGYSYCKNDKDKGVNVQVVLRCRPLSEDDVRVKTAVVLSCNEDKSEVTTVQNMGNKQIDKTFSFDKVFGPTSKQKDLYDQVVAPIVKEALEGFNWTIFAYGQTGTGKTYTMEGEGGKTKNGEFHEDVGVIPRAVEQIFDTLEAQKAEYTMKVTFIELYNEEITDLLAPDDKSKKNIALMEDGKGAVFMRGLEEEMVSSADEIHRVLEKGSARKHTAETLLNTQSNRSHSLFTITVQIKERTSDGVEVIKCGKLNLVDLAGSENILRSGAREGRAREAGEINKSLLTLGRVINALVDHSGHVPYRDSKLTRLLRDSLGGKTKTCIIATVLPSINSLEETLNTLDYAFRAKNIKNRPEVNQKLIKTAVIKELYTEINSLKQELHATREKNGIYIPHERFLSEEAAKKEMIEKLELKNKELMDLQDLFFKQQKLTAELSEKLKSTQMKLRQSEQEDFNLKDRLRQANETTKEKEYLIINLLGSEKSLTERASELRIQLENATSEVSSLLAKIEHKNYIEDGNKLLIQSFQTLLAQHLRILHKDLAASVRQQKQQLKEVEEHTRSLASEKEMATEGLQIQLRKLKDVYGGGIKSLVELAAELNVASEKALGNVNTEVVKHSSVLEEFIRRAAVKAAETLNGLQSKLTEQEKSLAVCLEEQHERQLRAYQLTQSASGVAMNFFTNLSKDISTMLVSLEEARTIYDQKLSEFGRKFEDYADNEEKQLLDEVTELLATSNARKKHMIQKEVDGIRDYIVSKTYQLHHQMSDMCGLTSSQQDEYTSFLGTTEQYYIQYINGIQSGKDCLTAMYENCTTNARMSEEQWRQFRESLCSLQKMHIDSVDSMTKEAQNTYQTIHSQLSLAASSTLEEADVPHRSSLSSVEYIWKLDHDEVEKINSLTACCRDDMKDMETAHSAKLAEIAENAEKCLINEYKVDDSSSSTPTKVQSDLPSMASIEEPRTPTLEELLKSFRQTQSGKQEIGDLNDFSFRTINGGRTNDLQVQ